MTIHNKTHLYMDQVSVDKVSLSVNNGEDILRIFWSSLRHILSTIRDVGEKLCMWLRGWLLISYSPK